VRRDVAAQIYGPDLGTLADLSEKAASRLRSIRGAVDVQTDPTSGLSYLQIYPDRACLARDGSPSRT
jgi:Cu/Ag efflux pump CusA